MDIDTCFAMLRTIKSLSFATVDAKGHPQVRIIDAMLADHDKLYFLTARGKDFYRELLENSRVAVVGLTKHYEMLRLNGIVLKLADQHTWIDRMFDANPSMCEVYPNDSRYILEAFCITEAQIEYFDLSKQPIYRETFTTKQYPLQRKGFLITSHCINCSACAKQCPQQCIHAGVPYVIDQHQCLHCGLCKETCPVNAIIKLY